MTTNTYTCNYRSAKKVLTALYRRRTPVYIEGPSGIGKTSLIREICEDHGAELVPPLILSGMEPYELKGLPNFSKDEDGVPIVRYTRPDFFPYKKEKPQVIFLDELPNAQPSLQTPIYQLVLENRIGPHQLPKDTWIVAAGNIVDDRAMLYEIQGPLMKRFVVLRMVADLDCWIEDFAIPNNIHPDLIAFLKVKPAFFDISLDPRRDDLDEVITPNPRSWVKVSDSMYHDGEEVQRLVISGCVGERAYVELMATLEELKDQPPINTLFELSAKSDMKGLLKLMPTKQAGLWGLVYNLISLCKDTKSLNKVVTLLVQMSEMTEVNYAPEVVNYAISSIYAICAGRSQVDIKPTDLVRIPSLKDYLDKNGHILTNYANSKNTTKEKLAAV